MQPTTYVEPATCAPPKAVITMAERFVQLYREWEEEGGQPEGQQQTLSEWLHAKDLIGTEEGQVSYLQGWNVRHLGEKGTNRNKPFEHDLRRYAVLDFDDGSYAFSPVDYGQPRRLWLAGRPV